MAAQRRARAAEKIGVIPSRSELSKLASQIRTAAVTAMSYDSEWMCLINVSFRDQDGKLGEGIHICGAPCRREKPAELVRVYFDVNHDKTVIDSVLLPLRAEIEPFIIGVGNVRTQDCAEGFVVYHVDEGMMGDRHGS